MCLERKNSYESNENRFTFSQLSLYFQSFTGMYQIKLDQFEGPLYLLLRLIEKEKLDISQISLAQITGQFIAYLNQADNISIDELADFLYIAAKLLLIKSQILFPSLDVQEEGVPLEDQLKIYKEYWEAAKGIEKTIQKRQFIFFKEKMTVEEFFRPPTGLTVFQIAGVFENIIKLLERSMLSSQKIALKAISIEERLNQLKELILKRASLSFSAFANSKDKAEKIVSFLALLELIKQHIVQIEQKSIFGEILIKKA